MTTNGLPQISGYGQYENDNYDARCLRVNLGTITLFYSYKTIVAYKDSEDGLIVCQNVWSTTTGKHLNWIDGGDKKSRLHPDEFLNKLDAALARHIH